MLIGKSSDYCETLWNFGGWGCHLFLFHPEILGGVKENLQTSVSGKTLGLFVSI